MGKPVILVPSPNVSEDHQTKNAKALTSIQAAVLIEDAAVEFSLMDKCIELVKDEEACKLFSQNIAKLGIPDAAERIVNEIEKLV